MRRFERSTKAVDARVQAVPSKRFEDAFRELPEKVQGQILKALDRIKSDPYHGQKLKRVEIGQYRYRVGDYRSGATLQAQISTCTLPVIARKCIVTKREDAPPGMKRAFEMLRVAARRA